MVNDLAQQESTPLCVDLDGTLIRSDLLLEAFFALLRLNPLYIFLIPFWLFKGIAHLKAEIARRITPDFDKLPYNQDLLQYLRDEREHGRKIILVTASNSDYAKGVADSLKIFDDFFASSSTINLRGNRKAQLLIERYGEKGFDYIGNDDSDLKVWRYARKALLVTRKKSFLRKVEKLFDVEHSFIIPSKPLLLIRALRVHQWVKNLLLFMPLVMAHHVDNLQLVFSAVIAYSAFCLCASSVYLINDLSDLEADRTHPRKSKRPLASGELEIPAALVLVAILLGLSFSLAAVLPASFFALLCGYFVITLMYSFILKRIAVLDLTVLATLYTLRIFAGGHAIDVPVSRWLLAFSMFIFFSLACVKRFSELLSLKEKEEEKVSGRGYSTQDIQLVSVFGAVSGYLSVLVMALYVSSVEVKALYRTPDVLWLICPPLLYWISRVWLLAHRAELHDDPIVFALRDKVSYLVGAISLLIVWFAI